jgi:methylmalonyl-CoA mutase
VISIDPSRRKSGGALLGDRIRMNAIAPWTWARSLQRGLDATSSQRVSCAAWPPVNLAARSAPRCPT